MQPDQPRDRGICGAFAPMLAEDSTPICTLMAEHPGWHGDREGMSWVERSPEVTGDLPPRPFTRADVDAAYERGKAEQRRERTLDALAHSGWSDLTLQHEDEQWSVWWNSPGGGLNVTVPTDDEADHEAACLSFQAEHGGEIKRRSRVTLVGEWHIVDQPELARGGIITNPGPAIVAEDGCDLVIPSSGRETGKRTIRVRRPSDGCGPGHTYRDGCEQSEDGAR
jgi:hypothetical protein